MRALGVLAGPRKGKVVDTLIDKVLAGLKDRGEEVEKISLYDYNIKPCTGCCTCAKAQKCVIDDDQHIILDKMDKADIVVFGSPTYWSNITSVAKVFFDRAGTFYEMTTLGPRRTKDKPSKVILITSCGMPFPISHLVKTATGAMRAMKVPFSKMKVKIKTLYATGMLDPDKSMPSERLLKKAYQLGKSV